jgi:hypothetical protein
VATRWVRRLELGPVPVGWWIVEALSDGDDLESNLSRLLYHVPSNVLGGHLVNIVCKNQPLALVTHWGNSLLEDVLGLPVSVNGIVLPILSIEIGEGLVVSEIGKGSAAGGTAAEIRWAHVSWVLSDDVEDGGLEGLHLGDNPIVGEGAEIGVGPGVRSNLMPLGNHAAHEGLLCGIGVDWSAPVGTVEEEGCLFTGIPEGVEEGLGVDVWAVIEGDGNSVWHRACRKTDTVWDSSEFRAYTSSGGVSWGGCCSACARSKSTLAAGSTVINAITAPSVLRATLVGGC